jgi:hypothetical protein
MTKTPNGHYDLAKQADYDAFAAIHGQRLAKAIRFALAYGVKYTGHTKRDLHTILDITSVDFAKLEAAFASQMRKARP